MHIYRLKWWFQDTITDIALWLIRKINTKKDRFLAARLDELAKDYNPKDTREPLEENDASKL